MSFNYYHNKSTLSAEEIALLTSTANNIGVPPAVFIADIIKSRAARDLSAAPPREPPSVAPRQAPRQPPPPLTFQQSPPLTFQQSHAVPCTTERSSSPYSSRSPTTLQKELELNQREERIRQALNAKETPDDQSWQKLLLLQQQLEAKEKQLAAQEAEIVKEKKLMQQQDTKRSEFHAARNDLPVVISQGGLPVGFIHGGMPMGIAHGGMPMGIAHGGMPMGIAHGGLPVGFVHKKGDSNRTVRMMPHLVRF